MEPSRSPSLGFHLHLWNPCCIGWREHTLRGACPFFFLPDDAHVAFKGVSVINCFMYSPLLLNEKDTRSKIIAAAGATGVGIVIPHLHQQRAGQELAHPPQANLVIRHLEELGSPS